MLNYIIIPNNYIIISKSIIYLFFYFKKLNFLAIDTISKLKTEPFKIISNQEISTNSIQSILSFENSKWTFLGTNLAEYTA
jgi:hypothetical protein